MFCLGVRGEGNAISRHDQVRVISDLNKDTKAILNKNYGKWHCIINHYSSTI